MNSFDNRLAKTTTYWRDGDIFFIKNTNFFLNEEEYAAIEKLFAYAAADKHTKAICIDNTEAKSVWPKNVLPTTNNQQKNLSSITKRGATLTNSHTVAMQMNRIAREAGVSDTTEGFFSKFNDEVKEFLLGA